MNAVSHWAENLRIESRHWLITGVAGFIGSHLLEALLSAGQRVTGLDDLSSGEKANLEAVRDTVGAAWGNFRLIEGSVTDPSACAAACDGVDFILHEAGFVSVPLSMADPVRCHEVNVTGTLQLLRAARQAGVRRFVYASSSAVYGDDATMPKREEVTGLPLSPYGLSKGMDELYAGLFTRVFGLETVGLRYFNVFGPRQNPEGGYAAVIPAWIAALLSGRDCVINGDAGITRDFVHIRNVVQANVLAALSTDSRAPGSAFNVGNGMQTTLGELYHLIAVELGVKRPVLLGPARAGDILHSGADIQRAREVLGYNPEISVEQGLRETVAWYAARGRTRLNP